MRRLSVAAVLLALVAACATTTPVTPTPPAPHHGPLKAGVFPTTWLNLTGISDTSPHRTGWQSLAQAGSSLGLEVIADGTLAGSWKIETSLNPNAPTAVAPADDPADISSGFSPTIATVVGDGGTTAKQFIQLGQLIAPYARVTFTPTSGTGNIRVFAAY